MVFIDQIRRNYNMTDEAGPQKRCCTCGETKPIELFSRNKSEKDGRKHRCKACEANYYAANAAAICQRVKDYQKANPDRVRQQLKAYREENAEYIREWKQKHYLANKEKILAGQREYYVANADRIKKRVRAYVAANKEVVLKRKRAWYAAHPNHSRISWHKRRALIKGNGGTFTRAERQAIEIAQGGHCAYCGRLEKLTIDHIIPISQGGRHEAANICLACAYCNNSKNNRTPEQWTNRWYLRKDE
jgi:5-methylcytosine-specific restriction endonuclease McrA